MNLLKIEEKYKYISFLSFHHEDPSKYRGRPSGFYELINNEETIGIIVQKLSNNLDAGKILAFAETKVVNFSYKKTSINFYTFSKYLLSKAIDNLINKRVIEINTNGKNYKLPSNTTVLKFTFKIMINIFSRLIQASFFEKKWNVAIFSNKLKLEGTEFLSSKDFINIPISKSYSFYADPFFFFK